VLTLLVVLELVLVLTNSWIQDDVREAALGVVYGVLNVKAEADAGRRRGLGLGGRSSVH